MSNYPDDIHRFDHDPRSPFYDEPDRIDCEQCGDSVHIDDFSTEKNVCDDCLGDDV